MASALELWLNTLSGFIETDLGAAWATFVIAIEIMTADNRYFLSKFL
jgi:hypothetical protein